LRLPRCVTRPARDGSCPTCRTGVMFGRVTRYALRVTPYALPRYRICCVTRLMFRKAVGARSCWSRARGVRAALPRSCSHVDRSARPSSAILQRARVRHAAAKTVERDEVRRVAAAACAEQMLMPADLDLLDVRDAEQPSLGHARDRELVGRDAAVEQEVRARIDRLR